MNDADNVSFGKPKSTGAVYVAPAGTPLPTTAWATAQAEIPTDPRDQLERHRDRRRTSTRGSTIPQKGGRLIVSD